MSPKPAPSRNSTCPRTKAGKAASSKNSLKHGLASGTLLIPGEDPAELKALETALFEEYEPTTATETLLVADMVKHHWLKDRALRLQGEALAVAQPGELPPTFAVLLRYQNTNERAFHKALSTLLILRKEEREFVSQEMAAEIFAKMNAPLPDLSKLAPDSIWRKKLDLIPAEGSPFHSESL